MESKFITGKKAAERLGVHQQTLYKYEEKGLIKTIRTPGGKRLYNVDDYLNNINTPNLPIKVDKINKVKIAYCNISNLSDKNNLENQINYMKNNYPNHEMIIDINDIDGLKKILNIAIDGNLDELVLKDNLDSFKLIEYLLSHYSNTNIILIDEKNFTHK